MNICYDIWSARRSCKLTSAIWKDFKPIHLHRKLVEAQCNYWNEILVATRDVGTSSVRRHIASCKSRLEAHQIVDKMRSLVLSPHASMLKDWHFDQETSRNELVRMIVLHELPFCIVEYEGFRNFVQSLNPLFKPICRNTAKSDCMRLYDEQRSALHEVFKNCNGRVSLTADMWSSKQTLGHLCITRRFIDNEWKIQKNLPLHW